MKTKNILLSYFLIFVVMFPSNLCAQEDVQGEPIEATTLPNEKVQPGKISLDIKGMDIIDVLKILAMQADLNIVAGKNVRGRVTVFLKNVDPTDVLEIILAANDLAYEKKGDIINVMTEQDYELLYGERSYDKKSVKIVQLKFAKVAEVGKSLTQIKSKIGKVIIDESSNTIVLIDAPQSLRAMEEAIKNMDLPTVTKTFVLNYAKAKDLEEKIKASLTKNLGEIKIDERMNKIVVTDLPDRVEYIGRIISDFDERDKVVLIEAKIVQITLNKDVGYGINWNAVFSGVDTIVQSDLAINLPGITAPTTFTYTRVEGSLQHGDQVILRLLDKLGKTDVLSTPRITVASNEEAKVLVGTKQAYVTSTVTQSNGTTTTADNVQFVDVGVSLSVTPIITGDGYINMKIKPEVSAAPTSLELTNPDGTVRTSVPIVTTSQAETQLLVKDGTSIIMAGLMKDTRKDNSDKVPLLGDIPLVGTLFRSKGKEDEKTELVIFLTPHIVKEDEDVSHIVEEYIQEHEKTGVKADDKTLYKKDERPRTKKDDASILTEIIVAPKNFQQYCKYVKGKIERTVRQNVGRQIKGQTIKLHFILASNGSLKATPLVLDKIDGRIKKLLIKSIKDASPFFPFPKDYAQTEEAFRMTLYFE